MNKQNTTELITNEVNRLTAKYGKDFLSCEDLVKITELGRDNVTAMMELPAFPLLRMGRRKIVSVLSFVNWQFSQCNTQEVANG